MVLKLGVNVDELWVVFESSVIFNGTQTPTRGQKCLKTFESSVIFNGTQTSDVVAVSVLGLRVV